MLEGMKERAEGFRDGESELGNFHTTPSSPPSACTHTIPDARKKMSAGLKGVPRRVAIALVTYPIPCRNDLSLVRISLVGMLVAKTLQQLPDWGVLDKNQPVTNLRGNTCLGMGKNKRQMQHTMDKSITVHAMTLGRAHRLHQILNRISQDVAHA